MTTLITPYEVPEWVLGTMVGGSDAQGWNDVIQRSYCWEASEVTTPPIDHYAIMLQRSKITTLQRRYAGKWSQTEFSPGDISFLSIAQPAHWRWEEPIEVSHIYLSRDLVLRVSREITGRSVSEVTLHDVLTTRDPLLASIALAITAEAVQPALGGALYVEALATQMAVHLLRHYSNLNFSLEHSPVKLDASRVRRVQTHILSNIERSLTVSDIADHAGMGLWAFSRAFKEATGYPPHLYILNERVHRARHLLETTPGSLKAIAAQCGFSDQAHMTRVIKAKLGTTPGKLRRNGGSGKRSEPVYPLT